MRIFSKPKEARLTPSQQAKTDALVRVFRQGLFTMRKENVPLLPLFYGRIEKPYELAVLAEGTGKTLRQGVATGFQDFGRSKYYTASLLNAEEQQILMMGINYVTIRLVTADHLAEKIAEGDSGGLQVAVRYKFRPQLPKMVPLSILNFQTDHVYYPEQAISQGAANIVRVFGEKEMVPEAFEQKISRLLGDFLEFAQKTDIAGLLKKTVDFPGNAPAVVAEDMKLG